MMGLYLNHCQLKTLCQKGSVCEDILKVQVMKIYKEKRKFNDESYIKSKLIIKIKKVLKRYRKNEFNTKNKTFQIS